MPEPTTPSGEYQYVKFDFSMSSGRRDGKSHEVEAYLLVPNAAMPEFEQWQKADENTRIDAFDMFLALKEKGALLHREDGFAYTATECSDFDNTRTLLTQERWIKGQQVTPGQPHVQKLGTLKL